MTLHFKDTFWQDKQALIDSRQVLWPEQSIFFAFQGQQLDGHQFIADLYQKGVRCFVVEKTIDKELYPAAQFLQVASSLACLQAWASWHRQQFQIPIVGITGSNAKTIVKEWLYQLLIDDFYIAKSPKSYNSQLGVALSVLQLQGSQQLAIFEAGISTVGEMQKLATIIEPTIGIFTNIGQAHDEGFSSRAEKISEKLLLFENCPVLIYCSDYSDLDQAIKAANKSKRKLYAWGQKENAAIQLQIHAEENGQSLVNLNWEGEKLAFKLPFAAAAAIENAVHCIVMLLHLQIPVELIQDRILQLADIPMRLEWKEGINQCMLVDDTYNNDLVGLQVALEFLQQKHESNSIYKLPHKKTLILSDIPETGLAPKLLYQDVAQLLKDYAIDKLIGIGPQLVRFQAYFSNLEKATFFQNSQEFIQALDQESISFQNETILLKGARRFQFEQLVIRLQRRSHSTVLEIDLKAVLHNFKVYRQLLHEKTKIMVMVKASAYGSSSFEIAKLLQYHKADYLGVAYLDEGIYLRERAIQIPIMVMNIDANSFEQLQRFKLEPAIYSRRILRQLLDYLKLAPPPQPMPIHIELDTGMHRLGFELDDFDWLAETLLAYPNLVRTKGIFSHLAAADEAEHQEFSKNQISMFESFSQRLESSLGYSLLKHILNSAGITRFPEKQLDMVRLGIGLHGIDPNQFYSQRLQASATLRSVISKINLVKAGQSVGYGRKDIRTTDRRIATIAIGYADGYLRAFGNGVGNFLIDGKYCPSVGNICMDMCFADVSHTNAQEGDEVVVFGKELPIQQLADAIGTIPYEILTHISSRVPRVFFEE